MDMSTALGASRFCAIVLTALLGLLSTLWMLLFGSGIGIVVLDGVMIMLTAPAAMTPAATITSKVLFIILYNSNIGKVF